VTSSAARRVVIAFRPSEWDQLLMRHSTPGQARFFLETRERDVEEVLDRHHRQEEAIKHVENAIPSTWRRSRVIRSDFPSFLFEPEDIVVAVGQDGLVPNLAKYLNGQPLIGVNPDPARYEGTLVQCPDSSVGHLFADVLSERAHIESRSMVEARLDDGQSLTALNEIYVGHQSHQSSRYVLKHGDLSERQSSSGLIVATGTGATGWARSIVNERTSEMTLPHPEDRRLAFFVREAWPSIATATTLTEGTIDEPNRLQLTSEMEEDGVIFGDGIEGDHLDVAWGQEVSIGLSKRQLRLVTP